MSDRRKLSISVNGKVMQREVETRTTLVDFLRGGLGCTGTHIGCEHGVCGACTVLVNKLSVRACLMLAVQAEGCSIETVEGLSEGDELNHLQSAFRDHHALQCGFCTPGFLMTLTEFLRMTPDPTEAEVRDAISGNLCRCTGYQPIVRAALDAAKRIREARVR
jgi:aerobic carbon-monoxide dehydrogenase small subunit